VAQTGRDTYFQGLYSRASPCIYFGACTNFHPQSKAQVPFLRRFAADWATAQIVCLQLKNRRAYKKRLSLPEDADTIEESGDDDDGEGEDMDMDE
jgi:hypothetical protein